MSVDYIYYCEEHHKIGDDCEARYRVGYFEYPDTLAEQGVDAEPEEIVVERVEEEYVDEIDEREQVDESK